MFKLNVDYYVLFKAYLFQDVYNWLLFKFEISTQS